MKEGYSYFDHDADIGVIGRGTTVAEATERAGLARRVAFLRPKVCIKR